MASLKLSVLLLLCVLFVFVSQGAGDLPVSGSHKSSKDTAISSASKKSNGGEDDDVEAGKDMLVSEDHRVFRVARQASNRKNKGVGRGAAGGRKIKPKKNKGRQQKPERPRQNGERKPLKPNQAERVSTMGRSVETFSVSLYKKMADANPDNFVFSPYSVFTALSMLLLGTAGRTKTELTSGLSIRAPVHPAIRSYNDSLDIDNNTVLAVANNLYYRRGLTLNPGFVKKLSKFYGATTEQFLAVNPESAVNAWVEDKTHGKIQDFLSPGQITSQVQAMLINAVYFKGAWKSKFNGNNTRPLPFFVTPSQSVDVDTMTQTGEFRMLRSDPLNAIILELPYVGDQFSLFVILPHTNLSDVESKLTAELLNREISSTLQRPVREVDVQLPKFELDTEETMKDMLQGIGITQVFDPSKASLKKMTRDRNVFFSEVIHRAVIEVDEEGTVAAAVTGVIVFTSLSIPPRVVANRPFVFVLRDKVYGINLFIGRFTNPGGDNLKKN